MRLTHFSGFFTALLLSLLTFSSCQKEIISTTGNQSQPSDDLCPSLADAASHAGLQTEEQNTRLLAFFTPEEIADLRANTCLAKDPADAGYSLRPAAGASVEERASGLKNRFWTPGQTIRVRFLNGSTALQNRVFSFAQQWEAFADVDFVRVNSGASEVRVMFDADGHWSYVGTENRNIDPCEKTMNLELGDSDPDSEIRRVTLHEFGHVLGLRHEHQQPLADIPWNKEKVYAYYAQQDWSRQEVDEQVLSKNTGATTEYTDFDSKSIMEYPVSASLTTNGYTIGWNTQLSATDKDFIAKMYSTQRIKVRHAASGYSGSIGFWLNGIYYSLQAGESVSAPAVASGNELALYEQTGAGGSWVWDDAYAPVLGKNYKIVRTGSGNNFSLVAE